MKNNVSKVITSFIITILGSMIGIYSFIYFVLPTAYKNTKLLKGIRNEQISVSRHNAITYVAQQVSKSVVTISVTAKEIVTASPYGNDFFFHFFYQPFKYEHKINSLGSGFIITDDGFILTNEHVVKNAVDITVSLYNGKSVKAKLVGVDPVSDIAVVKIDGKNLPYVELGNSDNLIIGEWTIAIGNPFGYLLNDSHPTVTVGVISAINRSFQADPNDSHIYRNMIQTDAAINPGNSGGPLVNTLGEVIGINTFIFSKNGGSMGIGFATPINLAKKIAKELIKYGHIRDIYLGIHVQELNRFLATSLGLNQYYGLLITQIDKHSPAAISGLQKGDIILKINNVPIKTNVDVREALFDVHVGTLVKFLVLRGEEQKVFVVQAKEDLGGRK